MSAGNYLDELEDADTNQRALLLEWLTWASDEWDYLCEGGAKEDIDMETPMQLRDRTCRLLEKFDARD